MKVFNNGHLKRAVLKAYSADIAKTKSGSLECSFDNDDGSADVVRVILVTGNAYENAQGIHLRRLNDIDDLNSAISNALETALKDGFNHIWVHNPHKPTEERRQSRIKCAKGWVEANSKSVAGNYSLNKLHVDVDAVLESMTEAQLDVLVAMVSGTFSRAHDESRANWVPLFKAYQAYVIKTKGHKVAMKIHDSVR